MPFVGVVTNKFHYLNKRTRLYIRNLLVTTPTKAKLILLLRGTKQSHIMQSGNTQFAIATLSLAMTTPTKAN
jgi:hypothetical protein